MFCFARVPLFVRSVSRVSAGLPAARINRSPEGENLCRALDAFRPSSFVRSPDTPPARGAKFFAPLCHMAKCPRVGGFVYIVISVSYPGGRGVKLTAPP